MSGTPGASTSAAKLLPVGDVQVGDGDAGGARRGDRILVVVPGGNRRPAGGQRQRAGAAALAEAEDRDVLSAEAGDGDHRLRHLSFRLERPIRASSTATIQKRMTICDSVQPSSSK